MRTLVSGGRTHGMGHLADVRYGCRRWAKRLLCCHWLTPACDRADSLLQQLLFCRVDFDLDPWPQSRSSSRLPGATIKPLETRSALVGMADSSLGVVAGWGAHDKCIAISNTPMTRPAAGSPSAMVAPRVRRTLDVLARARPGHSQHHDTQPRRPQCPGRRFGHHRYSAAATRPREH